MKKIIISLLMAAVTAAALTGCKEAGDIEDSSYVLAMGIEKTENGYLIDYSCADFSKAQILGLFHFWGTFNAFDHVFTK